MACCDDNTLAYHATRRAQAAAWDQGQPFDPAMAAYQTASEQLDGTPDVYMDQMFPQPPPFIDTVQVGGGLATGATMMPPAFETTPQQFLAQCSTGSEGGYCDYQMGGSQYSEQAVSYAALQAPTSAWQRSYLRGPPAPGSLSQSGQALVPHAVGSEARLLAPHPHGVPNNMMYNQHALLSMDKSQPQRPMPACGFANPAPDPVMMEPAVMMEPSVILEPSVNLKPFVRIAPRQPGQRRQEEAEHFVKIARKRPGQGRGGIWRKDEVDGAAAKSWEKQAKWNEECAFACAFPRCVRRFTFYFNASRHYKEVHQGIRRRRS